MKQAWAKNIQRTLLNTPKQNCVQDVKHFQQTKNTQHHFSSEPFNY